MEDLNVTPIPGDGRSPPDKLLLSRIDSPIKLPGLLADGEENRCSWQVLG